MLSFYTNSKIESIIKGILQDILIINNFKLMIYLFRLQFGIVWITMTILMQYSWRRGSMLKVTFSNSKFLLTCRY
jgi:hypothetical protein